MPCALAYFATRSVIRPCARNHGAITRRSAPLARRCAATSATPGCGPVANATSTPAQRVPACSARATDEVCSFAASLDEHAEAAVIGRYTYLGQSLPQHGQQRGILTEHPGLIHLGARLLDHRRNV